MAVEILTLVMLNLFALFAYFSVFFFSTLPKCEFENSKNQIFGCNVIILRKLGIKLLMKTHLTVLFMVCKSLRAHSD